MLRKQTKITIQTYAITLVTMVIKHFNERHDTIIFITTFGLVLLPFCFHLATRNINFSVIFNLNLDFGLIRKFAIQLIGLV